ncbi:proton-conducting transporter membrane subunit [Thiolinea disciformis]|uniref:proton-conducting transporter transmembrane domain-containing protein n=1 Tax=Thiolinea disciformis TaxID=125614 RepID=UPI0003824C9D|nr:proton-conducting transporter membrane subunit [Thiolinea disciformis]
MSKLAFMIALVPLLPLLAAAWIALGYMLGWNRGEAGERETHWVALSAATVAPILLTATGLYTWLSGGSTSYWLGAWLDLTHFTAAISFRLDALSLTVGVLFSVILLLVTRFSVNYLHREAGFQRYFMILSLFHSGVLLVVLAGEALLAFIGWELAGISSYLLIAYAWQRDIATYNATRAFVTNRIGDAAFILALFTALSFLGTTDWQGLFAAAQPESDLMMSLIGFGITLAAVIKSAQFPFSAWITRALEGPTPSSAVFYGSVLSHAGIYLLLRISPLLEQATLLSYLLFTMGLATVVYGWLTAQAQTDIKTSLIHATLVQTGLMLIEIALGLYTLATIHLVLHTLWRTYQFLHAPSFMQQTTKAVEPPPLWLRNKTWLNAAALQRFWLDPIADSLLVRPTRKLAQEAQLFDERIIEPLTGQPGSSNLLAILSRRPTIAGSMPSLESQVGTGVGVLGVLMQWAAEALEWFENRLVLQGSGNGLSRLTRFLGAQAELLDNYLRQPRYLLVLIAATLVVIL